MKLFSRAALAVLIAFGLAACSGSQETVEGPTVDVPVQDEIDISAAETFDSSPYSVEPPAVSGEVEHDVPEALMSGEMASDRTLRTVSGFRIQIHSSLIKDEAVTKESQIRSWWNRLNEGERPAGLGSGELAVYLYFHSPYYRVRIGNFGKRSQAEEALTLVRRSFPSAFITVDTVDIYR